MRLEKLKIFDSRLAGQSQLALTAGTGFIQKPFSSDDLANRVRELLDHVAA